MPIRIHRLLSQRLLLDSVLCVLIIGAIGSAAGCGQPNTAATSESSQTAGQAATNHAKNSDRTSPYIRPLNNTYKHYLKLGADGLPLAVQDAEWNAEGSEQQGTQWQCIHDVKTGFIWESKTENQLSPRFHLANYRYSQDGVRGGSQPEVDISKGDTPLCPNIHCTTQAYVEHINQQKLCGLDNWQLPTVLQFQTIVNHQLTPRAIDTHYFPLAVNSHYWTQQSYAPDREHAWYLYFSDGSVSHTLKDQPMFLRLVSPAESALLSVLPTKAQKAE